MRRGEREVTWGPTALALGALSALIALAATTAAAQDAGGPPDAPPDAPSSDGGNTYGGLQVTPSFLDLGDRDLGGGPSTLNGGFSLVNSNTGTITVTGFYKPSTTQCNTFGINTNGALPQTIGPGSSRTWGVSFTSSTPGMYSCRIDIQDNDGDYDFIDLFAEVVTPVMVVTPLSINYGDVAVGSSSTEWFTIQNNGSSNLSISSVSKTGSADFMMQPVFTPLTIPPTSSTAVMITYAPSNLGADNGQVLVSGNDPANTSDMVVLSGNGVNDTIAPHLALTPNPVAFGAVAVGSSGNRTLSIANNGGSTATVTKLTITGTDAAQFTLQSYCPGMQTCDTSFQVTTTTAVSVNLRCTPTSAGDKFATLTVTSNASNTPTTASLTCTGTAPDVSVSPLGIDFGTIRLGNTSAGQSVVIRNLGNATLSYTLPETGHTGDFAATPACTTACTLAPGAMTTHTVVFAPQAYGARAAELRVVSNDPVDPTVPVYLAGVGGAGLITVVSPASGTLAFGDIPIGTTSAGQSIQVRNDGNMTLTLSRLEVASGTVFGIAGTVPPPSIVINPGNSHSVSVTCSPLAVQTYLGSIVVEGNDPTDPDRTINLACSGIDSDLVATPAPISFAPTRVGDSDVIAVKVENIGGVSVMVSAVAATPGVFATQNVPGLPASVSPGGSLDFDLRFTPGADGDVAGTLTITSEVDPLVVSLLGPGRVASFEVAPGDHDFGTLCVGQSTVARFSVTSTGSADIQVSLPTLTDPDGAFDLAMIEPTPGDYPATLSPSSTAVFDVVTMPAEGDFAGSVAVTTDVSPGGTASLPISVSAIAEGIALSPNDVDFGGVIINETSSIHSVSLANCDDIPLMITAVDVTGDDDDAFSVGGTLPPPDLMVAVLGSLQWTVVFEPERLGAHAATLEIMTSAGLMSVPLVGVGASGTGDGGPGGDGGAGFDTTSYYACNCQGGADPGGALPILAALLYLLGIRRTPDRRIRSIGRPRRGTPGRPVRRKNAAGGTGG